MTKEAIPSEYHKLLDALLDEAQKALSKGEEVSAKYVIGSTQSGILQVVPIETHSPEAKEASAVLARRVATYLSADFAAMLTEAWALPTDKVDQHEAIRRKYGAIANYPGKQDVLSLVLETKHGYFSAMTPILPCPPSKKKRKIGEIGWTKSDIAEGVLTGILPKLA